MRKPASVLNERLTRTLAFRPWPLTFRFLGHLNVLRNVNRPESGRIEYISGTAILD